MDKKAIGVPPPEQASKPESLSAEIEKIITNFKDTPFTVDMVLALLPESIKNRKTKADIATQLNSKYENGKNGQGILIKRPHALVPFMIYMNRNTPELTVAYIKENYPNILPSVPTPKPARTNKVPDVEKTKQTLVEKVIKKIKQALLGESLQNFALSQEDHFSGPDTLVAYFFKMGFTNSIPPKKKLTF